LNKLLNAGYAIARININWRGRSFAGGSGSGCRIRARLMRAELPQTAQRCGREFEIVLHLTQYIAKGSGILQIGGWGVHSMTFPIEVHLLVASPLRFFLHVFLEKRTPTQNARSAFVSRRMGERSIPKSSRSLTCDLRRRPRYRSSRPQFADRSNTGDHQRRRGPWWRPLSSL
jgi:hypothetical protein